MVRQLSTTNQVSFRILYCKFARAIGDEEVARLILFPNLVKIIISADFSGVTRSRRVKDMARLTNPLASSELDNVR